MATVGWLEAQEALRAEVARVTDLLRTVSRPEAPAVGAWTAGQVAMHLSQAFLIVPALAAGDLPAAVAGIPGLRTTPGGALLGDLWELGEVTVLGVDSDAERAPGVLADRIDQRAAAFLDAVAPLSPDDPRPWLVEGVTVDVATLTCHLLNEVLVHGRDIAVAEGRPFPIDRRRAALVVDGFLMRVFEALPPHAMVHPERGAGVRVTYDVRVRGGGRHFFVFDDGRLTIEAPSARRVDCHLAVDPVGFLLVAWGRMSLWRAIARGQMVAWGRRPWLGLRMRGLVRNP